MTTTGYSNSNALQSVRLNGTFDWKDNNGVGRSQSHNNVTLGQLWQNSTMPAEGKQDLATRIWLELQRYEDGIDNT